MRKSTLCLVLVMMLAGVVKAQNIFTALHLNDGKKKRERDRIFKKVFFY